jgi:hypothetical protein
MNKRCARVLPLLCMLAAAACGPEVPAGATPVGDFLADPVYEEPVTIYGEVTALGELLCTCFILREGDAEMNVWYASMVEDDGTVRPVVSVDHIENGDMVTVDGELKDAGANVTRGDFWATAITEVD